MSKPLTTSEQEFKENFSGLVRLGEIVCEVCVLPKLIHPHRIKPGRWGGRYDDFNVAALCPTHHYAIHFLIDWFGNDKTCSSPADDLLLARLKADPALWLFWQRVQWPVCMEHLTGKRPLVLWRCQQCGTVVNEANESNDRKHCLSCEVALEPRSF